jgi:hypothetical protein
MRTMIAKVAFVLSEVCGGLEERPGHLHLASSIKVWSRGSLIWTRLGLGSALAYF